jgi:hypothetical protein
MPDFLRVLLAPVIARLASLLVGWFVLKYQIDLPHEAVVEALYWLFAVMSGIYMVVKIAVGRKFNPQGAYKIDVTPTIDKNAPGPTLRATAVIPEAHHGPTPK